jgi:hypothetical protein
MKSKRSLLGRRSARPASARREMVAMAELDPNHPTYVIKLAKVLEESEETTLGPTDSEICARALRLYVDWLEANT